MSVDLDIDDPNYDKKSKLFSCLNLIRASLKQDKDYIVDIMETIRETDKNIAVDKFVKKTVLNCYTAISFIKSADLIGKKSIDDINPFTKDNKALLNLEHYNNRYTDDDGKLDKDTKSVMELFEVSKDQVLLN
jgi:hypothetical protein